MQSSLAALASLAAISSCSLYTAGDESESSRIVRVLWKIDGIAPEVADPAACEGIADLEVAFQSGEWPDENMTFSPVPCELGAFRSPLLPGTIDSVRLTAFSERGRVIASATRHLDEADEGGSLTIDLRRP